MPRITKIARTDQAYAALLKIAELRDYPYDTPGPYILPKVPGVVMVIANTDAPKDRSHSVARAINGEQVLNPGFAETADGWSTSTLDAGQRLGITNALSHSGGQSAFMEAQPGSNRTWFHWSQTIPVGFPGDKYEFSAWVKKEDVRGIVGWYIHVNGDGKVLSNNTITSEEGSSDWKKVTAQFTLPVWSKSIEIGTFLYGSGVAYFDDASLVRTAEF
jgi:hypothetical protein